MQGPSKYKLDENSCVDLNIPKGGKFWVFFVVPDSNKYTNSRTTTLYSNLKNIELILVHDFHVVSWEYSAYFKEVAFRVLFASEVEFAMHMLLPKFDRLDLPIFKCRSNRWKWLQFRQHHWENGYSRARANRTAVDWKGLARASYLHSRSPNCWKSGLSRSPMAGDG